MSTKEDGFAGRILLWSIGCIRVNSGRFRLNFAYNVFHLPAVNLGTPLRRANPRSVGHAIEASLASQGCVSWSM